MDADPRITPELMYRAAAVLALLDSLLAVALTRRIGAEGLRRARWSVALVSGGFWLAVWTTMHVVFWAPVYSHVFPAWSRWALPPAFAAAYAALALGWRALALRAGRLAVVAWIALWGATGALTHTWAVYGRRLLAESPMLQDLTPLSAIVFATFEFGVYGCVILTLGALGQRAWTSRTAARA